MINGLDELTNEQAQEVYNNTDLHTEVEEFTDEQVQEIYSNTDMKANFEFDFVISQAKKANVSTHILNLLTEAFKAGRKYTRDVLPDYARHVGISDSDAAMLYDSLLEDALNE